MFKKIGKVIVDVNDIRSTFYDEKQGKVYIRYKDKDEHIIYASKDEFKSFSNFL